MKPYVWPDPAGALLKSPQSLVVYLKDDLAGRGASCSVTGRRMGQDVTPVKVVSIERIPLRKLVTCVVKLEGASPDGGMDGEAGDGGAEDEGGLPVGDDGSAPAGGDARGPDAPVSRDTSPGDGPGVDTAPPPDSGVPPSDAPIVPPDAPPDGPPPLSGCAVGGRKAFLRTDQFPRIAGCGSSAVPYTQADTIGDKACSSGWHWCKPEEVGVFAEAPGTINGTTCSWLDSAAFGCADKRRAFKQLNCTGSVSRTAAVGTAGSSTPCADIGLGCTEPWKFSIPLDRWNSTSVEGSAGGGCLDHVDFQCAGSVGGASCWITCCKNN